MLPTIDNNPRIAQAPGFVALTHEMIHETRKFSDRALAADRGAASAAKSRQGPLG